VPQQCVLTMINKCHPTKQSPAFVPGVGHQCGLTLPPHRATRRALPAPARCAVASRANVAVTPWCQAARHSLSTVILRRPGHGSAKTAPPSRHAGFGRFLAAWLAGMGTGRGSLRLAMKPVLAGDFPQDQAAPRRPFLPVPLSPLSPAAMHSPRHSSCDRYAWIRLPTRRSRRNLIVPSVLYPSLKPKGWRSSKAVLESQMKEE